MPCARDVAHSDLSGYFKGWIGHVLYLIDLTQMSYYSEMVSYDHDTKFFVVTFRIGPRTSSTTAVNFITVHLQYSFHQLQKEMNFDENYHVLI